MTEKVDQAKLKYVDFDLPFVLFVKDSLGDKILEAWADAYASGKRPLPYSRYAPASEKPGSMIIGGGFPVYIPPKELSPFYEIALHDIVVGMRTLRRVNPHQDTVLMGEVPGDRTGRASFSTVRVMFDLNPIREELHWNMELFCSLSIQAVNHFIDHYRVIADRPYIGTITASVIQHFDITTELESGKTTSQVFGTGSGSLHGFGGAIGDEQDIALRQAVIKLEPPNIDDTLDANIRDYLDLAEWRLVVIEAAVMFEAWLSRWVRQKYIHNGLSDSDIESKFKKNDGLPKSVTTIARNLVTDASAFDFSATSEYSKWEVKVRNLRNDIVHGKRFDVVRNEAMEAYSTVKDCISLLSKK
jgi:hypothetical protein